MAMIAEASARPGRPAVSQLVAYVLLSYLLAWSWAWTLAALDMTVEPGTGWPTHIPSLMAPLLAAVIVTGATRGRSAVADLFRRMLRWRFRPVWWLVAISPLVLLLTTLAIMGLAGQDLPSGGDFALFGGLPDYGVVVTFLLVLVFNGFGEETGWRGFLQDGLQRRVSPLTATLIVALVWALWHAPFFVILSTYTGFEPITLVMFPLGLTSGAVVLTWLYNHTGRSILAVAIWHTLYNMAVATSGGTDLIQAVVTTVVITAAVVLVIIELVNRHRGRGSVLAVVESDAGQIDLVSAHTSTGSTGEPSTRPASTREPERPRA